MVCMYFTECMPSILDKGLVIGYSTMCRDLQLFLMHVYDAGLQVIQYIIKNDVLFYATLQWLNLSIVSCTRFVLRNT